MLKLLLVIAGAYLLLLAIVYLTQASMLYVPNIPGREFLAAPDADKYTTAIRSAVYSQC